MFRLGAVTDEVNSNFEQALDVIGELGIRDIEIHTLWGTHIEALSDEQVKDLSQILKQRNLRPVVLDSTIFLRCQLNTGEIPENWSARFQSISGSYDQHLDWLERCLNISHYLDAPYVRIFGFWRNGDTTDKVITEITARLREATSIAARTGVTLVLENCPHTFLGQTRQALQVIRAIDSPWLRLLWDPANAYRSGESDFTNMITDTIPYLTNMHVKGIILDDKLSKGLQYVRLDHGEVDFHSLLSGLLKANYSGVVSIEPHYTTKNGGIEGAARESFTSLSKIVDSIK